MNVATVDVKIIDRLKKIAIFQTIKDSDESINALLGIISIKNFPVNSNVIVEQEMGDEMYIVLEGGVRIQKKTNAGDDYTVLFLEAEQNVFFGEMALIDDDKRSATVVTTRDSSFLVIKKKDFLEFCEKRPEICWRIILSISRIISNRLRKTSGDMLTIFNALVNEIDQ